MYMDIILGLVCLSVPLFAKYGGFEHKKKPYDLVGIGGLFFLLGVAFPLGLEKAPVLVTHAMTLEWISKLIGLILLVIGVLRAAYDSVLVNHRILKTVKT